MADATLQTGDGSLPAPAYTFVADPDTGLMRLASGTMGIVSNGVLVAVFGPNGLQLMPGTTISQIAVSTVASGTASKQAVAGDLTIQTNSGHAGGYLGGVMGNALISGATDINNSNVAGVIGKGTIQGTLTDESHPVAGVIGEASGKAHAALVAVVSDTDGSAGNPSTINAAIKVEGQFSNDYGTSTCTYGIDMQSGAHDVYQALDFTNAAIRFPNGTWLVMLSTAITANVTTTSAPAGSIGFTSHATGNARTFKSDGAKWQVTA